MFRTRMECAIFTTEARDPVLENSAAMGCVQSAQEKETTCLAVEQPASKQPAPAPKESTEVHLIDALRHSKGVDNKANAGYMRTAGGDGKPSKNRDASDTVAADPRERARTSLIGVNPVGILSHSSPASTRGRQRQRTTVLFVIPDLRL